MIEVLTAMVLLSALLALTFGALRGFWLRRSFEGAQDQIVTELRRVQDRSRSESHPLVYGVRFTIGQGEWAIVRYDPKSSDTASDDVCTEEPLQRFGGIAFGGVSGVEFSAAEFTVPSDIVASKCPGGGPTAFFYARGNATPGVVTITHEILERSATIRVSGLTGRVEVDE